MTAYLRIRDLPEDARNRLHIEIAALIVQTVCYPPFFDQHSGTLSTRPWSMADRERARAFVNGSRVDELDTTPLTDQQFIERIRAIVLRYQNVQSNGRIFLSQLMDLTAIELDQVIRQMQRRFIDFLEGKNPSFGAVRQPPSWQSLDGKHGDSTKKQEIMTQELAQALLILQGESGPAIENVPAAQNNAHTRDQPEDPSTFETKNLPAIEIKPAALPQLPTVRLPETIDIPHESEQRRDSAIFQQIRSQLLEKMEDACRAYGVSFASDDPAGILSALEHSAVIDEADIHLAECVLALCQRVIERGRADIEEYRQAMTLYVLFHRSRFATAK